MHTGNLLFDLGLVLFAGFFAALAMKKINQSVVIGYMLAGLLIGPNVLGIIKDTKVLTELSELGIVFLMFFLGIEFSINKFKRIKNSVFFIGTYEVVLNLVIGIAIGAFLGFASRERLFFAAIVALSSSSVVAKLLFDLKRTASRESEVLMGVMVFEDFIAIIILGILSGLATFNQIKLEAVSISMLSSAAFYGIFILIGIFIINKFIDELTKIESQELFTALMIGIILLVGAFASYIGLASAAGAFLFGMVIVSYDVEERLHRTVAAFKDIFLIVFFISFGMLLNPSQIPGILWMIAIVVPATVLGEIIITSSSAYFSGFSSKSSFSIGTSMIARGEYSLIIATLGLATGAISESLYQFTGVYVFLMTLIAPVAMRHSNRIRIAFSKVSPPFLRYGARLVSTTMRPVLLPETVRTREKKAVSTKEQRGYKFLLAVLVYIGIIISMLTIKDMYVHGLLAIFSLVVVFVMRKLFIIKIHKLEGEIDYANMHQGPYSLHVISRFIANLFSALLVIVSLGAAFSGLGYYIPLGLIAVFFIFLVVLTSHVYKKSRGQAS